MIKQLPNWAVLDSRYDFDDVESNTAVEQTARLYKAIQDLIEDWNAFESKITNDFSSHKNTIALEVKCFEKKLTKLMHNYLRMIDDKINLQNSVIDDAISYMKDNLATSINEVVTQMAENGDLDEAILNSVSNITETVNNLSSEITNIKESLNTVSESVNTLSQDIESLSDAKDEHTERIQTLEDKIIGYSYIPETETLTFINIERKDEV